MTRPNLNQQLNQVDLRDICQQVSELSREVGRFSSSQSVSAQEIETKSMNNFVSRVDKEAEEKFVAGLSLILPAAGFITEEETTAQSTAEWQWIVDPLDGTTNFLHGIPFYCTSVALTQNGRPLIGVIYNPKSDNLFYGIEGHGAFLNGEPIKVTDAASLQSSLLATGFPYDDFGRQDSYMELLKDYAPKQGVFAGWAVLRWIWRMSPGDVSKAFTNMP